MCFAPNIISHPAGVSEGLVRRDILGTKELNIHLTELLDSNLIHYKILKWFGDRLSDLISKSSYLGNFYSWYYDFWSIPAEVLKRIQPYFCSAIGFWSPRL